MTKIAALREVARMAERQADQSGLLKTAQAADFYDTLAVALQEDCKEEATRAEQLAAMVRETERQQLKFRELLKS
jgi:hypothetical protein